MLVVAAMDRRVKAVVSQVPFISGHEQFVLGNGQGALAAINHNMNEDRQRRLNGEEPGRVALVRMPTDPADKAVLFERWVSNQRAAASVTRSRERWGQYTP